VVVSAVVEGDALVLKVANSGDPIKPENLSRVFQPYWRPNTSKPGGGLGLGLYICTEIAKAHGGRMEVASSAAAGTVFGARLPIVARP
jgi:signal transduction histidine kinase